MNVLQLTTHLNMGGVARYILDISTGLKRKGIECYVASAGGDLEKEFCEKGIELVFLDMRTKFEFHPKLIFSAMRLARFVKEKKIDVVHGHTRVAQVMGIMVSKMTGVPFVSTCHGYFKHTKWSRKVAPCWGKRVIAISDNVKTHLIDDFKVPEDQVDVVYNGVDPTGYVSMMDPEEKDRLKRELKLLDGPVLGTIGRLSPVKGFNYLLYALKEIKEKVPGINLLLIGEGPQGAYLKKLSEELGLMRSVYFMKSRVDARKFLPFFDIYIFPSVQEGLGLSLLEAMASARPCIATETGGIPNVINHGENGLLVPPANANRIADEVLRLMKDPALALKISANAKNTVIKNFSISSTISGTINFYGKVVDEKK